METIQTLLYGFLGIWAILIVVGIIFSGCSVVKTDFSSSNYKEGMVYYYLPESLVKITSNVKVAVYYQKADSLLTGSSRVIEQKFVVTTENIADTRELLSLQYKPNALMSDKLTYKVTDKGLLESVEVTTEDKTAAIVKQLANAPEQILGIESSETRAPGTVLKLKEYSSEFFVKASDIMGREKEMPWNILITNELGKDDFALVSAAFKVKIKGDVPVEKTIMQTVTESEGNQINGILTRPLLNADLLITTKMITGTEQVSESTISIVDRRKVINVPIKRSAFVKRVNTITISEGIIKSNEITNPSSIEGFASIPIDVAKAIVSVPGQLVTFRYDNTQRLKKLEQEKGLLETELLKNEQFKLKRENEINKLLDQIKTEELTRANDASKLQFELQKQLLEAEKTQLDMLKQLEALKKEIEELKANGDG